MRWLARAAHREPEGSIGFGAPGRGPVLDHPVSVRAFGAPSALDERAYVELGEPESVAGHRPALRFTSSHGIFALGAATLGKGRQTARRLWLALIGIAGFGSPAGLARTRERHRGNSLAG